MTVFLHDEMYGIRDGLVETVWPVFPSAATSGRIPRTGLAPTLTLCATRASSRP